MTQTFVETFRERVTYAVDSRVATITLDRADRLNAFDSAMYEGINDALVAFRDDDMAWAAVIQAAGTRAFSAGADVHALNENARQGITTGLGGLLLDNEMVTDKPLIAAVQGHCIGEGVNLILGCDVVFADTTARFAISEVRIGVNPVDIPLKLARRLGYARSFRFLTPGDPMDANWARNAGLVEHVSAAGKVQAEAKCRLTPTPSRADWLVNARRLRCARRRRHCGAHPSATRRPPARSATNGGR